MSTACGGNMDSFMTVRIDSKVPMLQAVLLQQQAGAGSCWDTMGSSGSVWLILDLSGSAWLMLDLSGSVWLIMDLSRSFRLILGFSGLQMGTSVFRYSGPQQRSLDSSKS
jgi:hypothetical protein